jgi:hypothetical protein
VTQNVRRHAAGPRETGIEGGAGQDGLDIFRAQAGTCRILQQGSIHAADG